MSSSTYVDSRVPVDADLLEINAGSTAGKYGWLNVTCHGCFKVDERLVALRALVLASVAWCLGIPVFMDSSVTEDSWIFMVILVEMELNDLVKDCSPRELFSVTLTKPDVLEYGRYGCHFGKIKRFEVKAGSSEMKWITPIGGNHHFAYVPFRDGVSGTFVEVYAAVLA